MPKKAPVDKSLVQKFLGIDYGKSKVGIAIADSETRIAFAYDTLKNDRNLFQNLAELAARENVSRVIIGIPSRINGQQVEYPGEKAGIRLQKKLGIAVEYENEMFTTKIAYRNLAEKGVKGIKKHDDREAARIILQSWLDKVSA